MSNQSEEPGIQESRVVAKSSEEAKSDREKLLALQIELLADNTDPLHTFLINRIFFEIFKKHPTIEKACEVFDTVNEKMIEIRKRIAKLNALEAEEDGSEILSKMEAPKDNVTSDEEAADKMEEAKEGEIKKHIIGGGPSDSEFEDGGEEIVLCPDSDNIIEFNDTEDGGTEITVSMVDIDEDELEALSADEDSEESDRETLPSVTNAKPEDVEVVLGQDVIDSLNLRTSEYIQDKNFAELRKLIEDNPSWKPNLEGADLARADFSGLDLQGVNINGANLQGGSLQGAKLSNASLNGANLCGVDLSDADLKGASLRNVNVDPEALAKTKNIDEATMDQNLRDLVDLAKFEIGFDSFARGGSK